MYQTTFDRLREDVSDLTIFPDRRVGSEGHAMARDWVAHRMQRLGLRPFSGRSHVLPYDGAGADLANVVGVVPAATSAGEGSLPIVLGAHYDTVPGTPGADDNAAAVAVVLEVASRLLDHPVARPVVIAVFDAEEPPYFHSDLMGSTRFVADHVHEEVHAAIILDLIAHAVPVPGLENLVALMGAESHPAWAGIVRGAAEGPLPILAVPNDVMPDMSDHYAFRLAQRPYLFVTCGQGEHYHAPGDTLDNLDLDKALLVAELVESLVRRAADAALDGARPHDGSELEVELMHRVLGAATLERLGVRSAADARHGLTQLVFSLQANRA